MLGAESTVDRRAALGQGIDGWQKTTWEVHPPRRYGSTLSQRMNFHIYREDVSIMIQSYIFKQKTKKTMYHHVPLSEQGGSSSILGLKMSGDFDDSSKSVGTS